MTKLILLIVFFWVSSLSASEQEAHDSKAVKPSAEKADGVKKEEIHGENTKSTVAKEGHGSDTKHNEHPPEAKHEIPPKVEAAHHEVLKGVDPRTALGWLKNGNTRYIKNRVRNDGRSQRDRDVLSKGQKPHTILLSCSDSRVPPELVFDQALGELFVIRVAGEALDSSVIASIEYAVEHLGTRNIVVLGHTECGAVKAALNAKEGESSGSPAIDKLIADIRPRIVKDRSPASEPSEGVAVESKMNVNRIVKDLPGRSKILKGKLSEQAIKISSALYNIKTGVVEFQR